MFKGALEPCVSTEILLAAPRRYVPLRDICLRAGIGKPKKKAVLQKVRGIIEQSKPTHGKRFTEEESKQSLGGDWQEIGWRMNGGAKSVTWPTDASKAFTHEEEERLVAAFEARPDQAGRDVNWWQVADGVGGSASVSLFQ